MKVLVVGGAGYIGSHTVRQLSRKGHGVRILDNLSTGHRSLVKGHELLVGDIHDQRMLRDALRGVDAVIHFAAHACVGESVMHPRKYFANNVQGALHLLNGVLDAGVQMLIFSSSCAVYGVPSRVPITEDEACRPVNPYGATKLFFEQALGAYHRAYGLRSVSLRYFNAAGADEDGDLGELHDPETHLLPCILRAAAGLQDSLEIYGGDYPTADGTCIRDFVHVSDLADAHVLALDYLAAGGECEVLNLGTGSGHSVRQIVSLAERITGRQIPHRVCERRPGDPPVLTADPSRARAILKWQARFAIDEIVASAWRWQSREHAAAARSATAD